MLLPLLLNNLMGKRPTPPTPGGGEEEESGSSRSRAAGAYMQDAERRKRILNEDEIMIEVLKTFIQCL